MKTSRWTLPKCTLTNLYPLELNAVLETMIEKAELGKWRCKSCGQENDKYKIRRHVEVHLNMSHTCIVCGKDFKTTNSLSTHFNRFHGNYVEPSWSNK